MHIQTHIGYQDDITKPDVPLVDKEAWSLYYLEVCPHTAPGESLENVSMYAPELSNWDSNMGMPRTRELHAVKCLPRAHEPVIRTFFYLELPEEEDSPIAPQDDAYC